jgi:hypothetical protein
MRRLTMVRQVGRASVYLVVPPRRRDSFATILRRAAARELDQLRGSPDGITSAIACTESLFGTRDIIVVLVVVSKAGAHEYAGRSLVRHPQLEQTG